MLADSRVLFMPFVQFFRRIRRFNFYIINMQNQLIRQSNLALSSLRTHQGIKFILKLFNNSMLVSVYEGHLNSFSDDETMSKYFQTFQDIQDHIKTRQNILIDTEKMSIKLVYWVTMKKSKKIEICEIKLSPTKNETNDKLFQIIQSCSAEGNLKEDFIKQSLKSLAQTLQQLMTKKEQKFRGKEILQPNLNQEFRQFKKEIYSLLKQNSSELKFPQNIRTKDILEERVSELQLKYDIKYSKINSQVSQIRNSVTKELNEKVENLSKIFATEQEIEKIINKIKILGENLEKMQVKYDMNYKKNIESLSISTELQPYLSKFKITENLIQYKGQDKVSTKYVFDDQIPNYQDYSFKIKIRQVKDARPNLIHVGIIDKKSKNQRNSLNQNCFYYFRSLKGNGYKYPPRIQQGNGFGVGDFVEVRVDITKKKISWNVNGSFRGIQLIDDKLGDPNTIFMPFVEFYFVNSAIQWIK